MRIANNVLRENLRSKVLYVLAGLGLLVTTLLLTGNGTITNASGENLKATLRGTMLVGFNLMGVFGTLVTLVLSMNTIPREFERKTTHLLLVRPVHRWRLGLELLLGNILASWTFVALMSAGLVLGLLAHGGQAYLGRLALAVLALGLNTALMAGVTTLLSSRLPGPAAAFVALSLYGLGSFAGTLRVMFDLSEGLWGKIGPIILPLIPPIDGVIEQTAKLFGPGALIDGRVYLVAGLYLYVLVALTAASLYGKEV